MTDSQGENSAEPGTGEPETPPAGGTWGSGDTYRDGASAPGRSWELTIGTHHREASPGGYPRSTQPGSVPGTPAVTGHAEHQEAPPETSPEGFPGTSAGTQHETAAGAQYETPAETRHETPAGSQNGTPAETQHDAPAETQHDMPAETQHDMPAETRQWTSAATQQWTPAETHHSTPAGTHYGTPAGTLYGTPPGGPPSTPPGTGGPGPVPGLPPLSPDGGKRRLIWAGAAAAVVVIIAAAAGAYALLHTRGSPQQTAQEYLSAWQQDQASGMQQVSSGVPAGGLARPIHQADTDLGVRSKTFRLGTVQSGSGGTANAAYTAALTLGNGIHWTYQGSLQLVRQNRHWRVAWSDAAIYPQLRPGERFKVAAQWLPRAPILAADGSRLDSSQAMHESGSIAMITGSVGPLTAAQAKHFGQPYQQGDMAGQGGIEQADERRLAGTPRTVIQLVDSHGNVQHQLASFAGKPGTPVKTSIDMSVQQAASHAVASANVGSKPVAMVAIRPSTGDVLAVVNRPGGFDRALQGTYPPGSTFKMITSSALVETGMRPSDSVPCPATISIGGHKFHNYDYEKLGTTNLLTAFAVSCNTTFAQLGSQKLTGAKLTAMAEQFGFNSTPQLGIPAALGHFSSPPDPISLAMDAFGQGEDIVDPLQLATVAGALGNGTWRAPRLVLDPAPRHIPPPHHLDPAITSALQPMMAAVVSEGTAAHVGFPPGVHGKTGTAEYGNGPNPPSHAWFAGYRGDLAFAVIVEGGGVGADSSGPIANAFVRGQ